MKSKMNRIMSLCLLAMMSSTIMPQPIQAEGAEQFEANTIQNTSINHAKTNVFEEDELKYRIINENEVEVIGFATGYDQSEAILIEGVVWDNITNKEYIVTSIGDYAFQNCKSLKRIRFDDEDSQIETIGQSAFDGCTSLESIDLDSLKYLKTIRGSAFKWCNSIDRIELPEGLETIRAHAFDLTDNSGKNDDPQLSFINIPSTVKTLGDGFLCGARPNGDTTLVFQGENLPTNMSQDAFYRISGQNNKPTVYFPKDAIDVYAGKNSPFVKAGLINPNHFDSSYEPEYETIKICPGKFASFPRKNNYSELVTETIISDDPNVVEIGQIGEIWGKSIGETMVRIILQCNGKEIVSDAPNKVKVKVDHHYTWQIETWPTKDQPGSMFHYCVDCGDKKESVPIPPTGIPGGGSGGSTGGSSDGSSGGGSTIKPNEPTKEVQGAVYRAYNPYNGEHLYTTNYVEFRVITQNGWDDEGIAFMSESKEKGYPLYRVYNPNEGLHHYTIDEKEKNTLVSLGWNDEGVACYTSKNPTDAPVFRVYNPNGGQHHYTMDANEALILITMGWQNEGIAFLTSRIEQ